MIFHNSYVLLVFDDSDTKLLKIMFELIIGFSMISLDRLPP